MWRKEWIKDSSAISRHEGFDSASPGGAGYWGKLEKSNKMEDAVGKNSEGDGRKNGQPDPGRWLSGKSRGMFCFSLWSYIQLTRVSAYSFARLWDPRRRARTMASSFSCLLPPKVTSLHRGFWTELIMRLTSSSYGGRISLPVNCITIWYICCFDVQMFVKMIVPHCIYLHGLNLAVIYVSQPIIPSVMSFIKCLFKMSFEVQHHYIIFMDTSLRTSFPSSSFLNWWFGNIGFFPPTCQFPSFKAKSVKWIGGHSTITKHKTKLQTCISLPG